MTAPRLQSITHAASRSAMRPARCRPVTTSPCRSRCSRRGASGSPRCTVAARSSSRGPGCSSGRRRASRGSTHDPAGWSCSGRSRQPTSGAATIPSNRSEPFPHPPSVWARSSRARRRSSCGHSMRRCALRRLCRAAVVRGTRGGARAGRAVRPRRRDAAAAVLPGAEPEVLRVARGGGSLTRPANGPERTRPS